MKETLEQWVAALAALGGSGVLLLGFLDSSFLILPFGIEIYIAGLSADSGAKAFYFAAMGTAGSVGGSALIYFLSRKGGEEGLDRFGQRRQIDSVKARIEKKAVWAVVVAAMMPPPFPYRVFVAVAGALQYPWKKLAWIITLARFGRFTLVAFLGVYFGGAVRALLASPEFFYTMLVVTAASLVVTGISIAALWKRQP